MFLQGRFHALSYRTAAAALALFLTLSGAGCGERDGADQAGENPEEPEGIPVAVAVLETGTVEAVVRSWGTVHPEQAAQILSEVAGQVSAVHVSLGDRVEKGRVLLEIDPALFTARAKEAESLTHSAKLTMEKAGSDLERAERLFERGTISDSELEAARTRDADAEAAHASARAALEQATKNLSSARLRAPFSGHVASRPPDPGSTVGLGAPLVTVVAIDRVRVEAQISEQDLGRISVGGEVSLTVEGLPGRVFTGVLDAVGPQADPGTRQFPVEIAVDNRPDRLLKGGMVARVEVVHEVYEDVPLLPVEALVETEDGMGFYVIEDGRARLRRAALGPRRDQMIAILEGGAPGDSAVVLGQGRLSEGSRVRVEEGL